MDLRMLLALASLAPVGAPVPPITSAWEVTGPPARVVEQPATGVPAPDVGAAAGGPNGARARQRTGRWRPPVSPVRVRRPIALPDRDWLPGHRGVDLGTELGTRVHSAGAGRVSFAGQLAGRGVVVIDHGRLRTTYEPVAATVPVGAAVLPGDPIGTVAQGTGHCAAGDCLHWGLRQGSLYLDPLLLIGSNHALLRPW